jgi:hypothetical protein
LRRNGPTRVHDMGAVILDVGTRVDLLERAEDG